MSESELIEDPREITALYFPNEGGIQWQGEAYLPADYVLSRGREPVAYALYDPDIPDDFTPLLTLSREQVEQLRAEGWQCTPLYAHPETTEPSERENCPCFRCIEADIAHKPFPYNTIQHMVLCPTCGNKRCPHAEHHDNPCTGSNEPGQPGATRYPARPVENTEEER